MFTRKERKLKSDIKVYIVLIIKYIAKMHPRFVIFHLLATLHLLFSLNNFVIQQGKIRLEPISSRIFHAYKTRKL